MRREKERGAGVWWRGSFSFLAQKERVSECLQRSHSVKRRRGDGDKDSPGLDLRMRTEVIPRTPGTEFAHAHRCLPATFTEVSTAHARSTMGGVGSPRITKKKTWRMRGKLWRWS